MLPNKPLDKIIFSDIETTSQYPTFKEMPEKFQNLFKQRFKKDFAQMDMDRQECQGDDDQIQVWYDETVEAFYSAKAPTQAEWLKVIAISCSKLALPENPEGDYVVKTVCYSGDDEKELLQKFAAGMNKACSNTAEFSWVFHHGNAFDVPVLIKRFIINGLPLPKFLDVANLKPWERGHIIDTKVEWSCGVYDSAVSLDHLAAIFNVPSSKEVMHGGDVKDVYWIEKDLKKIADYCSRDTIGLSEIYMRIKGIKNKLIVQ